MHLCVYCLLTCAQQYTSGGRKDTETTRQHTQTHHSHACTPPRGDLRAQNISGTHTNTHPMFARTHSTHSMICNSRNCVPVPSVSSNPQKQVSAAATASMHALKHTLPQAAPSQPPPQRLSLLPTAADVPPAQTSGCTVFEQYPKHMHVNGERGMHGCRKWTVTAPVQRCCRWQRQQQQHICKLCSTVAPTSGLAD